jgi:hypothetical protein
MDLRRKWIFVLVEDEILSKHFRYLILHTHNQLNAVELGPINLNSGAQQNVERYWEQDKSCWEEGLVFDSDLLEFEVYGYKNVVRLFRQ